MLPVSLVLSFASEATVDEKLCAISDAGISYINIPSNECSNIFMSGSEGLASGCRLLKKSHLRVDWVHSPFEMPDFTESDGKKWRTAAAMHTVSLDIAMRLGARSLIVHALNTKHDGQMPSDEKVGDIVKGYRMLVSQARTTGVTIATENLLEKSSPDFVSHILDEVSELGLCFDTGHAVLTDNWKALLNRHADRIVALHIHDNHGLKDDHLIPGEGVIDLVEMLSIIHTNGYKGIWGVECQQKTSSYPGDVSGLAEKIALTMESILNVVRSGSPIKQGIPA